MTKPKTLREFIADEIARGAAPSIATNQTIRELVEHEDMTTTGFTPEEESRLTALDAAAHDLMRLEDTRTGKIAPCWLVCSEETRIEYRRKVIDLVNGKLGLLIPCTLETAPRVFSRLVSQHLVDQWRDSELKAKQARDAGSPRAFFT